MVLNEFQPQYVKLKKKSSFSVCVCVCVRVWPPPPPLFFQQMESIWHLPDTSPLEFADKLSLWVFPFLHVSRMIDTNEHKKLYNIKTDRLRSTSPV